MKNDIIWFLALAVLGASLCPFIQSAMAQQPTPDPGQQGEFNGENVDTGAAALDAGPEPAEVPEAAEAPEAGAAAKLSPVTAGTTVIPVGVTAATATGSAPDLEVEGNFDLQEIARTDTPEIK